MTVWISISRFMPAWVHDGLAVERHDDGSAGFRYPDLPRTEERRRVVRLHQWLCEDARHEVLLEALADELAPLAAARRAAS